MSRSLHFKKTLLLKFLLNRKLLDGIGHLGQNKAKFIQKMSEFSHIVSVNN